MDITYNLSALEFRATTIIIMNRILVAVLAFVSLSCVAEAAIFSGKFNPNESLDDLHAFRMQKAGLRSNQKRRNLQLIAQKSVVNALRDSMVILGSLKDVIALKAIESYLEWLVIILTKSVQRSCGKTTS